MDRETREHLAALNEKLDTHFKSIHEDMTTIKRGIYGDEQNQVKGLLTRQNEDDQKFTDMELRVSKVEKKQFKSSVILTALMVSAQLAWNTFKEYFR